MTILVTGATGHLGHLVIDALLARGVAPHRIVAGARDRAKAADLADRGVQVRALDYDDPATIATALDGVESVLLVSGSEIGQRAAQHQRVIDAAASAGVSRFVYTSLARADVSSLILAPEHVATEAAIVASGLASVILRNNWYTENYAADLALAAETGVLAASTGEGRVASASRADYAEAAAAALLDDAHLGAVYELAGDTSWDYADLAAAFTEITGRPVAHRSLSTQEHAEALSAAGLDAGTVSIVTALDAGIRDGALADTDGTLSRLIGRPTTPLIDGLRALS